MVTLLLALAVGFLLVSLIKVVKLCTSTIQDLILELRLEKQFVSLQKQIVSEINLQIGLQRQLMDKQLAIVMNSITAMKLMVEKESDPKWIQKFNEGRDNARFN